MPSSILNSDDGVISGTAGLKNSGGDDGVLVFQSKGTDTAKLETNGDFAINAGFGSVGKAFLCRAWVNFDGTDTPAIRASGNVSSITDNGTGQYTVNFATAMPDANYSIVGFAQEDTGGGMRVFTGFGTPTSSARPIEMRNAANSLADCSFVNAAIFR